MRKSSKILAIVLTLVLLVGAISVFASAAAQPNISVSGTGITNWGETHYDFETAGDFDLHWNSTDAAPHSGFWNNIKGTAYAHYSSRCSCHNLNSKECPTVLAGNRPDNVYGSLWYDKTETKGTPSVTNTAYIDLLENNYQSSGTLIGEMDYQVWDMDITSDRYLDADGNFTTEATDAEGNPNRLAFHTRYAWSFFIRGGSGSGSEFKFKTDSTGNYITIHGNDIPLDIEAGEWFHLSIVFAFDHENIANSSIYYYLDGVLVASKTAIFNQGIDPMNTSIGELRINKPQPTGLASDTSFSECIDNVAVHYYSKDYTGPMSEVFSPTKAPETLGACSDMVYTYGYQYPAPNQPVASVTLEDGATTNYYTVSAAVENLAKNCTLTLQPGVKLDGYAAYFPFKVYCDEGAFSVISNDFKAGDYIPANGTTPGGYEVKAVSSSEKVAIYFYTDAETAGENGEANLEVIGDYSVPFGGTFIAPENVAGIEAFVLNPDNTYKYHTGWAAYAFYDDDEAIATPVDLTKPLTEEMGYINVYPTYDTGKLLYGIYNHAGNLLKDSLGGYTQYADANALASEITKAYTTETKLYVKLLDDVKIDNLTGDSTISISGAYEFYFDLNGHDYIVTSRDGAKENAFATGYSPKVYIYSSVPGARIFHGDTKGGGAMINAGGGATITLGTVTDPRTGATHSGDNLSTYTTILVSFNSRTDLTQKVTIDGGDHFCVRGDGVGYIQLRFTSQLTIKNAFVSTPSGTMMSTDKRYLGDATPATAVINIENSVLVGGANGTGRIFGEIYNGVNINIKNSDIYGSLAYSLQYGPTATDVQKENALLGKVNLGENVRISDTAFETYAHVNVDAGFVTIAYDDTSDPIAFTYYAISYDGSVPAADTFDKAVNATVSAKLTAQTISTAGKPTATITYQDADGNVIETKTEIVGVDVIGPQDKVSVIDLDNVWFNLGFTYWADAATGEKVDFINMADGTVATVKAVCETPVADVFGYANMSLMAKFTIHTYMPAVGADGTLTVSANGKDYIISAVSYIKNDDNPASVNAHMDIGGVPYAQFNLGYPSAMSYTGKATLTYYVSFTVTAADDAENTVSIVKAPVANNYCEPSAYLIYALENAANEADKELLANVIQYCNTVYDYVYTVSGVEDTSDVNKTNHQKLVDIIAEDEYKGYVTDIESETFDAMLAAEKIELAIPAGLLDHVAGLTLLVKNGTPALAIVPVDTNYSTTKIVSASVTVGSFASDVDSKKTISLLPDHPDKQNYTTVENATGYWCNLGTHLMAYYACNDFTFSINVAKAEGEGTDRYEIQYNLANYILSIEANGEATDLELQGAKVARAFRAYADSAYEFVMTPEA